VIVALTASSLEEDRAVILSEGCDDYMRKPFHENDLFEMIAKHLGVRYVYAEQAAPQRSDEITGQPKDEALSPEAAWAGSLSWQPELLSGLLQADPAWVTELERVTTLGDLDEITRLAAQIAAVDPSLAEALLKLANQFEHDQILAVIAQVQDGRDS
jgi:CheY-like chemotaxis protein